MARTEDFRALSGYPQGRCSCRPRRVSCPSPVAGPLRTCSGPGAAPLNPFPRSAATSRNETPGDDLRDGRLARGMDPSTGRTAAASSARTPSRTGSSRWPSWAPTTASGTSRRRPASSAPGCCATTATRSGSCSARTASRSAGSSSASPRQRRCGQPCRRSRRRPCRRRRRFRRPAPTSTFRPRRSTAAAPSTTSSSASRTSSPTPPRGGSPRAGRSRFNPLFLYGGVGLGKTHLMHAIAWEVRQNNPEARVLYLSAEQFMYRFVSALRFKDMHGFKEMFRSVDMLMVDDVQFISGKDFDPGGVLPHLQRADRAAEADRHLRRPRAGRDRRARGAHQVAAAVGAGRRPAPDRLRAPPRHPAGQGRGAAGGEPGRRDRAGGDGVPRAPDQLERARARGGAEPALRLCEPDRAARSTST